MADSILAVRGLSKTTDEFRRLLFDMAKRNGWDVDAIATVISNESGFEARAKNPYATASGLIQMIDSTARRVGIKGGAAELRTLSAEAQVPYIEKFYQLTLGGRKNVRPVDFYLAGWGAGIGQPSAHVLARSTDAKKYNNGTKNLYDLNYGLDRNKDGTITVGDLAALVASIQAAAKGERIPLAADGSELDSGSPLSPPELPESTPPETSDPIPSFNAKFFPRIDSQVFSYTPEPNGMVDAVKAYQRRHGLLPDGVIGPITWTSLLRG